MRRPDRVLAGMAALLAVTALPVAFAADAPPEPPLRHRAPVVVDAVAPFVRLPLDVDTYARSEQTGLGDLRVFDSRGDLVPFALLGPRSDAAPQREQVAEAALYPLPARPATGGAWPSPIEVRVEGDRISVTRSPAQPAGPGSASPGWLIDLGELATRGTAGSRTDAPAPQSLRLRWSGPAEFSVGYALETSDDLRQWRVAGGGQLMALAGTAGPLTQPLVTLPPSSGRFVRLVWDAPAQAPQLSGAESIRVPPPTAVTDPPTELTLAAGSDPKPVERDEPQARRALHFDLGAVLPLARVDLRWEAGTHVLPARLQVRSRSDEPWQPLAAGVFYRLDRNGDATRSPALEVHRSARYLRVVPDDRAGAPDAAQLRLVAGVRLASVVFAAQGQPPYELAIGAARATPGALPIGTLVPSFDDERARFGRASLGPWRELDAVARQAARAQQQAALRPWLLWGVLLLGVAALGAMVWRLARAPR